MSSNTDLQPQQDIKAWAHRAYGEVKDRAWDHFDPLPTGITDQKLRKAVLDYFYACAGQKKGNA